MTYPFDVLGLPWTAHFLPKKTFNRHHAEDGYDVAAVTVCDDKQIHFRRAKLTRETVIHELCHAYIFELGAARADLNSDQLEEVYCDMVAKFGERIWKQADEILLAYKILKGVP